MGTPGNVKIEPMTVTWGEDVAEVQTVTTVADVSSSLNNKYFFLYSALNAVKYHIWYNVGSAGTDPNPGGSTAVVVAISANATANTVATATAAAVDALAAFVSTASQAVVTVTNAAVGYSTQGYEGVGTGFSFALTTEGDTAADIGFADGDIEIAVKENLVEIKAHQTGSNIQSEIRTGKTVEVTIKFKETSTTQLSKLLRQAGGTFTPAGANSTEVNGWGSYRDFTQTLSQSKKLVLHPVALSTSDHSRDFTVHQAYANLDKLTFSGENIFMVPVKFRAYPKYALNDRVEYFSFGDGTQTLT